MPPSQHADAMGVRGSQSPRCLGCGLQQVMCACALLPRIENNAELVLLTHAHDVAKPSNTARLLLRCLANARQLVFGRQVGPRVALPPCLVLHPDGRPLLPQDGGVGKALLVPDGTWSQVRRMLHRVEALRTAELVSVSPPVSALPVLRRQPSPMHLSTFAAVACALGVLEGAEVERRLLKGYAAAITRSLSLRPQRSEPRGEEVGP